MKRSYKYLKSFNDISQELKNEMVERFYGFITKTNYCWEWGKTKKSKGYGSFSYKNYSLKASRMSWMIHNNSDIPNGLQVRHTCDNVICVNPAHLILGTHAENMNDKVVRGRSIKKNRAIAYRHYRGKNIINFII